MRNYLGLTFLALAGALFGADPYIGYIYPAALQAGTTNRLIVGGQAFRGNQSFRVSGEGITVLKTELVPNFPFPAGSQRRHLRAWLDGIHAGRTAEPALPAGVRTDEWRTNRWWSALDTLDRGQRTIVERDLYTPRNALQASPSLRQMALVTVAVDAKARPGRYSLIAENPQGMSAPRPLYVTALRHVAEPLYTPPHRPQPPPPLVDLRTGSAVLDGQIMPGETDVFRVQLAAGRTIAFRVRARELQPYIGDAVPGFFNASLTLKDAAGRVVAFADDEKRFLPDPVLTFTAPADGTYRLEIHDVLYRGRQDFVYAIFASPPRPAQRPKADGLVAPNGEPARKTFTIDAPGPRVLNVTARRRGSSLDAVLTLRKASDNTVLAQWDDVTNTVHVGTVPQAECDPIGTYTFTEPGTYVAEISDRTGHGGPDYYWWLDIRPPKPGFAVYSTRSTLPLVQGTPLKVGFQVVRTDGFTGDVTIEAPLDVSLKNNVITAGVDRVTASLEYLGRGRLDAHPIKIFAHATINGETVRVPVKPCDEYEQAFAWKHLVPAESFILRASAPRKPQRGRAAPGAGARKKRR